MLTLKQINDKYVRAIPIPSDIDKRPIKGYDICQEIYANIFLCAKKKSGKTSTLFKIMKECSIKKTIIVVFCSTVYKDENWIEIRKYFERKGNDLRIYTSIYEDGEDQLAKLIDELTQEAKEEENKDQTLEETGTEPQIDKCDDILLRLSRIYSHGNPNGYTLECDREKEKEKKHRKCKYRAPEYMIVFDDLSSELKSRSLLALLKKNRHYKSKIIISSQWLHDLLPESRKQIDVFMIFKGFPERKLHEIYKDCDSSVPFDLFYKIYRKATQNEFSFLFIDSRVDKFRQNFDKEFVISTKCQEE